MSWEWRQTKTEDVPNTVSSSGMAQGYYNSYTSGNKSVSTRGVSGADNSPTGSGIVSSPINIPANVGAINPVTTNDIPVLVTPLLPYTFISDVHIHMIDDYQNRLSDKENSVFLRPWLRIFYHVHEFLTHYTLPCYDRGSPYEFAVTVKRLDAVEITPALRRNIRLSYNTVANAATAVSRIQYVTGVALFSEYSLFGKPVVTYVSLIDRVSLLSNSNLSKEIVKYESKAEADSLLSLVYEGGSVFAFPSKGGVRGNRRLLISFPGVYGDIDTYDPTNNPNLVSSPIYVRVYKDGTVANPPGDIGNIYVYNVYPHYGLLYSNYKAQDGRYKRLLDNQVCFLFPRAARILEHIGYIRNSPIDVSENSLPHNLIQSRVVQQTAVFPVPYVDVDGKKKNYASTVKNNIWMVGALVEVDYNTIFPLFVCYIDTERFTVPRSSEGKTWLFNVDDNKHNLGCLFAIGSMVASVDISQGKTNVSSISIPGSSVVMKNYGVSNVKIEFSTGITDTGTSGASSQQEGFYVSQSMMMEDGVVFLDVSDMKKLSGASFLKFIPRLNAYMLCIAGDDSNSDTFKVKARVSGIGYESGNQVVSVSYKLFPQSDVPPVEIGVYDNRSSSDDKYLNDVSRYVTAEVSKEIIPPVVVYGARDVDTSKIMKDTGISTEDVMSALGIVSYDDIHTIADKRQPYFWCSWYIPENVPVVESDALFKEKVALSTQSNIIKYVSVRKTVEDYPNTSANRNMIISTSVSRMSSDNKLQKPFENAKEEDGLLYGNKDVGRFRFFLILKPVPPGGIFKGVSSIIPPAEQESPFCAFRYPVLPRNVVTNFRNIYRSGNYMMFRINGVDGIFIPIWREVNSGVVLKDPNNDTLAIEGGGKVDHNRKHDLQSFRHKALDLFMPFLLSSTRLQQENHIWWHLSDSSIYNKLPILAKEATLIADNTTTTEIRYLPVYAYRACNAFPYQFGKRNTLDDNLYSIAAMWHQVAEEKLTRYIYLFKVISPIAWLEDKPFMPVVLLESELVVDEKKSE